MVKVSYAITVSTEIKEFTNLMQHLTSWLSDMDEIVVLVDESKGFSEDIEVFEAPNIHYYYDTFNHNFAEWKNKLNSYCTGDWIFQLDADEIPSYRLVRDLHNILKDNTAECISVPRRNIVEGITEEDIQRWHWVNTDKGINWPDYQYRIYRNNPSKIYWKGKVHERPVGFNTYALIPDSQVKYKIDHFKDIKKQREQNEYYSTLQ